MIYTVRRVQRTFVDFASVPEHQWAIDKRLKNWALAQNDRLHEKAAPMFVLYKSSDAKREYGAPTSVPADRSDAHVINTAMAFLPEKHRLALAWYYVKNGRNPIGKASELGFTPQGLADCVIDARQMLIVRKI